MICDRNAGMGECCHRAANSQNVKVSIWTLCMYWELSHRRRTDSGTVIWYENQSAHARPPASFRRWQNHELVFAHLSSVQNQDRKSQAANQRSSRWLMGALSTVSCYTVRSSMCEIALRSTTDEWRGRSQLIALRPRIRRARLLGIRLQWTWTSSWQHKFYYYLNQVSAT